MILDINSTINKNELDLLKKTVVGKDIDIIVSGNDKYTTTIRLSNSTESIFIVNLPITQVDDDEYPKITVSEQIEYSFEENFIIKGNRLKKITLIQDTLLWESNGERRLVKVDIGLKFYLEDRELLFIAIDSVGGLIRYYVSTKIPIKTDLESLREYWVFKTDDFTTLKRDELDI